MLHAERPFISGEELLGGCISIAADAVDQFRDELRRAEPGDLAASLFARAAQERRLATARTVAKRERLRGRAREGRQDRRRESSGLSHSYSAFHSRRPTDHCGWAVTSRRSALVVTALNVSRL